MSEYKMIAMDLDDTLLNDQWEISSVNREAIDRAVKAGIKVVIATGRMYRSALPYARTLGLDTPLITYQGAYVRFPDSEKVLYNQPLSYALMIEILEKIKPYGFHTNIYIDDQLLVEKMTEEAKIYWNISGVEPVVVGDLTAYLAGERRETTKMVVVVAEEEKLNALEEELRGSLSGRVHITKSKPIFLELMQHQVDKGRALAEVAKYYGIARENIIAVGDSYNDLEMLDYAGLGVAVDNAREEIKTRADYVTTANTKGGVANVIHRFIFHEGD